MLKFFKKKQENNNNENNIELLTNIASLFIHAAKIDENYTNKEKDIIKKALIELNASPVNVNKIISNAEKKEAESNQILDFTKQIKKTDKKFKIKIIEVLWGIIYSNNQADMYEANLMRRLSGLLYLDNKVVGNIKEKIKNNLSK